MHCRIFHITRNRDFDNINDYDIYGNELLGDRIDSIEEIPKDLWENPNGDFGNVSEVRDLIEYLNRRANIHIEYSEKDFSFTLNADALKALKNILMKMNMTLMINMAFFSSMKMANPTPSMNGLLEF